VLEALNFISTPFGQKLKTFNGKPVSLFTTGFLDFFRMRFLGKRDDTANHLP